MKKKYILLFLLIVLIIYILFNWSDFMAGFKAGIGLTNEHI